MSGRGSARRSPLAQIAITSVILSALLIVITLLTDGFGDRVLVRVVTVMLVNVALTVALQMFMGNSGLSSFGHVAFMAIGAYSSLWFTLTPQEKSRTLPDMPETWIMHGWHTDFLPASVAGGRRGGGGGGAAGHRTGAPARRLLHHRHLRAADRGAHHRAELGPDDARQPHGVRHPGSDDAVDRAGRGGAGGDRGAALPRIAGGPAAARRAGRRGRGGQYRHPHRVGALGAWVASIFITGAAGALWAHFITTFSPQAFYIGETFIIVAMLIIGGSGSVSGAVIGAVLVSLSSEWLRRLEGWLNQHRSDGTIIGQIIPIELRGFAEIVIAIAMIIILIKRPAGLTGGREIGLDGFWGRARRVKGQKGVEPGVG